MQERGRRAVGSGSTDDTVAIQACTTAAYNGLSRPATRHRLKLLQNCRALRGSGPVQGGPAF